MPERTRRTLPLLILLAAAALPGCGDKPSDKPYAGQSILVIVPKLQANLIRGPIIEQAEIFNRETGARVRVVTPDWDETIKKIDQSLTDPNLTYDIFVVLPLWKGTLQDHAAPVPDWVKQKIDWNDVLPIYRDNVLTWNNTAYGLPYDGDCINLYYRKDLFENPDYRRRFKQRHGYELAPPRTWKQYRDIAAFFNGWDWNHDGRIEHGITGLRVKGDVTLLQFFAQAGAYAKHPDEKAYYFDPRTMKPRINNPGFVRALREYVDDMRFGPPGMANFSGQDVRNTFASGQVAMAIDWADTGVHSANSPVSVVQNKVGYAQLPGADEVFNPATNHWEQRYNQASSISGSWMFLVNKDSPHRQLAFEFAAHMTAPELTRVLTATTGTAVNPSRFSHFKDAAAWEKAGFSTESARRYLDEITRSLSNPNVVTDITIPGAGRYYQALDEYVHQAVLGRMTPQAALDAAAAKWETITDELGRERQIAFYRQTLNLPAATR
jgi:multiple sugar transport system substrate-binding protein